MQQEKGICVKDTSHKVAAFVLDNYEKKIVKKRFN